MLKLHKNKGVSLIELMVAVGLGLVLIFSMLAYYSISQQNVVDYNLANQEQQNIRKMMNLLAKDVENTGGFECAEFSNILTTDLANSTRRFPANIISLGDSNTRKQIIFAHPVTKEYLHKSLGMIDVDITGDRVMKYNPILVNAGCGQDANSPLYIGSTIFEMVPVANISLDLASAAADVKAFIALSSIQTRLDKADSPLATVYNPIVEDGTVLFLTNESSDAKNKENLPFGNNSVDIFLGFSKPIGADGKIITTVPDRDDNTASVLTNGGWINPFAITDRNFLIDKTEEASAHLLNKAIHLPGTAGQSMKTYPLKKEALDQIRAVKFKFTFDKGTDKERTFTRVVRFKNMHLMKLKDGSE